MEAKTETIQDLDYYNIWKSEDVLGRKGKLKIRGYENFRILTDVVPKEGQDVWDGAN